jgi:hypothetical protein
MPSSTLADRQPRNTPRLHAVSFPGSTRSQRALRAADFQNPAPFLKRWVVDQFHAFISFWELLFNWSLRRYLRASAARQDGPATFGGSLHCPFYFPQTVRPRGQRLGFCASCVYTSGSAGKFDEFKRSRVGSGELPARLTDFVLPRLAHQCILRIWLWRFDSESKFAATLAMWRSLA